MNWKDLLNAAQNASTEQIDKVLGEGSADLIKQRLTKGVDATTKEIDNVLGKGASALVKGMDATKKEVDDLLGKGSSKLIKEGMKSSGKSTVKSTAKGAAKGAGKGIAAVGVLLLANDIRQAYADGGVDEIKRQIPMWTAEYGGGAVGAALGTFAGGLTGNPLVAGGAGVVGGIIGSLATPKLLGLTDEQAQEVKKGIEQTIPKSPSQTTPTNMGTGKNYVGFDRGATGLIPSNKDMQNLIVKIAQEEGVDPAVALAMAQQESGFNPKAISEAGAIGVMQLMPATAKELGVDPYNTEQNIRGGLRYLKQQMKTFDNSLSKALAAYNAGAGSVMKYGGVPPKEFANGQTYNYVNNISNLIPRYREALQGGQFNTANVPASTGGGSNNNPPTNTASTGGAGQPSANDIFMTLLMNKMFGNPTPSDVTQALKNAQDIYNSTVGETVTADDINKALSGDGTQSQVDGMNKILMDAYTRMQQASSPSYMYQGDVVNPSGYYVDIDKLKRDQQSDLMTKLYEYHSGLSQTAPNQAEIRLANALANYQANIANQAGVPYQDYITAMEARRTADVANSKFLAEQALKVGIQQMIEQNNRAKILKDLYTGQQDNITTLANTLLQGNNQLNNTNMQGTNQLINTWLSGQNTLANTDLSGQYDLTQEKMKQNNPYTNFGKVGSALAPMFYNNPQGAAAAIQSMSPQLLKQVFPNMTPEAAKQLGGSGNNYNPNQASQSGLFNAFWNSLRGLQANEE